jgi:excisionase family DNA binding protein
MDTHVIIQGMTSEEFFYELRKTVAEAFEARQPAESNSPQYLTRREVAALFKITAPTLHKLTMAGTIPAYRIGGRVLYKPADIEAALDKIVIK